MKKLYIIDTCTIVHHPQVLTTLKDCAIVLPITVLEELDKLKSKNDQAGKNARIACKLLSDLTEDKNPSQWFSLDSGSKFLIDSSEYHKDMNLGDPLYGDNRILACALHYHKACASTSYEAVFLTRDVNAKVRSRAYGVKSEHYEKDGLKSELPFSGIKHLDDSELINNLFQDGFIDPSLAPEMLPNEFLVLRDKEEETVGIARMKFQDLSIVEKQYPWDLSPKNPEQVCAVNLLMDPDVSLVTLIGAAGSGKSIVSLAACLEMVINRSMYDKVVIYRPIQAVGADVGFLPGPQPLSAKIATPNGWTTMGEIKVGDKVISRDGSPTNVIGIFPKGKKKVYRVHTSDNTYTECCEDHLWLTQDKNEYKHNYPGKVRSTKQLMETLMRDGKPNHWLPRNGVVQYNSKDVPIDPYTLGALLGDGCTTNSISLCSNDPEILDRVEKVMSNNLTKRSKLGTIESLNFITKPYNNKTSKQVKITDLTDNSFVVYESIGKALMKEQINRSTLHHRCNKNVILNNKKYEFLESKTRWQNDIKNKIYNLGLLGKKSYEKFIPDIYKYNSKEVRIELIRGLMDTDGTIKKNGESSFTTTSLKMAEDIIEVVKSLGGNANLRSRNRVGKKTIINNRDVESKRISYEFNISLPKELNPFYLKRKAEMYDQKFIFRPRITNIELVREDEVQCIRVDNPEHLYLTDNFIVTHNTLEEKLSPWMEAIYDSIEVLFKDSKEGKGGKNSKFKRQQKDWREDFQMYIEKGQVELNCMTHVRGRSLPNCIIFIDEVQNISKSEIKTLLTRAGENTKIILTGDIEQIDNPSLDATNNGLSYVLEKFKDYHIAGHVTLTRGERSELATIASEIL